jgi:hypothetical protein
MIREYLNWLANSFRRYHQYSPHIKYSLGDIVIYKKSIYKSLVDGNLNNNPSTSKNWSKIL